MLPNPIIAPIFTIMASKLITLAPHEASNQLESSLRQAYSLLLPKLTPPLKLTIPSPEEYLNLNKAIVYGVLCEPNLAKTQIKYLHGIVNDGYCLFINLLSQIVDGLYSKMLESPRVQLIWVTSLMIDVSGIGFDGLLVSLLRQIVGGDFSDGNLWLSYEMVSLIMSKWDLILDEEPIVLSSALYTYLRLLADHNRLPRSPRSIELKRKEISFCVRMLREQFHLCLSIGRDLVRLLQDLVHIPVFRAIWKDLVLNPGSFGCYEFSDISHIYGIRTSSKYFLLRITPEMETQLRFLLTHVKLGSQRRHQAWFARKFLFVPQRETLIIDIVRFICCSHHPSNEVLESDVVPRWAVIGWLLKLCTKKYIEANVKLTLFYDWLFFDEKVDSVMNVEPAMLLLVNSIPGYINMTNSLLEFLLLVVENYDMDRKNVICKGVSSAMNVLVNKGVIGSLDILTSCNMLSPFVKEMLQNFMLKAQSVIFKEPKPTEHTLSDMPSQSSPNPSKTHLSAGFPVCPENVELNAQHISLPKVIDSAALLSASCVGIKGHVDDLTNLIGKVGELIKSSSSMGQELVENILHLYINPVNEEKFGSIGPEYLACELKRETELAGYKLFSPLGSLPNNDDVDDEVQSVTAAVIRTYIISQRHQIKEMLLWWSRNGCSAGARLLSYALRLAHEAHEAGYGAKFTSEIDYKTMPLLKCHIEGYLALKSRSMDQENKTTPEVNKDLYFKIIDGAFTSYRNMLNHTRDALSKEMDMVLGKLLSIDVVFSSLWNRKFFKFIFRTIFAYLPDLSHSDEDVILLLLSQLEDVDLLSMQIDLGLKRFAIFGEDVKKVFQLIRRSVYWKQVDQHKLWCLIRSELTVSMFPVEKLLLDCLFSADFDSEMSGIAVGGLLGLCSSCAPTPEIVGAVMLLPNKYPGFAAAILSHWTTANAPMFSNSVVDFLNKVANKNGNAPFDWGSVINQSALLFLIEYFEAQGVQGFNMLERLASKSDIEKRLENPTVLMDMDTG